MEAGAYIPEPPEIAQQVEQDFLDAIGVEVKVSVEDVKDE